MSTRATSRSGTKPRERQARWTATVEKTLHENPFFAVMQQKVRLPDQSETTYFTVDFPRPAVGVVAMHKGQFLLLRQHRFIVDEFVWAIPSGGIHLGETPLQAAARELREETGYRARRLRRLQWFYASYGCSNQVFDIFLAEGLTLTPESFDRNEVIGLRWFSRRALKALIARNGIVDGLSLAPLLLMLLHPSPARVDVKARQLKPPIARG